VELFKCPGSQGLREPVPEYIECPFCKGEVEIWSDEAKTTCPSCKRVVFKDQGASCVDWCQFAEKCLGEELYRKVKAERDKS
jgi:hypothetical protein